MRTLFLFLILHFVALSLARAQDFNPVYQLHLENDLHWRKLLHYQKVGTFTPSDEGQIDAKNFYLSPEGKTNPEKEFKATLESFFAPAEIALPESESAICRFPARYLWIRKKLQENKIALAMPQRDCPRFQTWFETLRGTSASLVFSSYFLNNPSSTFGHTLLRINKAPSAKDGRRYELLDYGVNFAANADTSNPLFYAVRGLFGGFPGTFTTVPYYYKVREYNNSESRDLWEYELNLSQEATDMLVLHIWEVGPTYADYWYLSENCSYFMLGLLEAADPKIDVTSKLKKFVIPTDTVQVIFENPGLVKNYHFRPSVRTELFYRLNELSEIEKSLLANMVDQRKIGDEIRALPEARRQKVLDTAIDDMDYLFAVAVQKDGSPEWKFKNEILSERSHLNAVTEPLKIEASYREEPHAGHGSRRVGLGYLTTKESGNTLLMNYRFAFHDILDPVVGFPEYAQISFFDFKFGYEERPQKLELEELNLFEVISLSPYSRFSKSLSWRLKVAVEKLVNEDCWGCHAGGISGGAGYTLKFADDPRIMGYLGLKAGAYYTSRDFREKGFPRWLLGAGPNLTLRARWTDRWITSLEAWYRKDMQVSYNEFKEVSLSNQWSYAKNYGLRLTGVERWFERAASVDFFLYY